MVTETIQHYHQPHCNSMKMAERRYVASPTPETVSVADAMLKLSSSTMHMQHQNQQVQRQIQHQQQQQQQHHHQQQSMQQMPASTHAYSANQSAMNGSYNRQPQKHLDRHGYIQQHAVQAPAQAPSQVQYPAPGVQPEYAHHSPQSPISPSSPRSRSNSFNRLSRKEREFVPEFKKDDQYWVKRQKNNEAAKRSREKRRMNDMAMSDKLSQMAEEKDVVVKELEAIKRHFGLPVDKPFKPDSNEGHQSVNRVMTNGVSATSHEVHNKHQEVYQTSSPTTTAPPLIPIQGAMMESMTQRPVMQPPPVQQVSSYMSQDSQEEHHSMPQYSVNSGMSSPRQSPIYINGQAHSMSGAQSQDGSNTQLSSYSPYPSTSPTYSRHQDQRENKVFQFSAPCTPESPHSNTSSPQNLQIVLSPAVSEASSMEGHAPLNLSKRRRIDLSDSSSQDSMEQRMALAHERKGIPHKLRYKNYTSDMFESSNQNRDTTNGLVKQEDAQREDTRTPSTPPVPMQVDEQSNDNSNMQMAYGNDSNDSTFSYSTGEDNSNSPGDLKYLERRYRNNLAARKCRENRRLINDLRQAKADLLESENGKLKEELRNLSDEVHGLKRMIEQKHQAKITGESFDLPKQGQGNDDDNMA